MFDSLARQPRDLWGVGVDVDQYQQVETVGIFPDGFVERIRARMLTSVVKRLDLGIAEAIGQFAESGEVQDVLVSIANDGVQYTTSGDHITPWIFDMEAAIQAVKSGEVVIDPEDRSPTVLLFDELLP